MLREQSNLDYYKDRSIANSTLSLINPKQLNSPKTFKLYLDGYIQNKPQTVTLENGSILHMYAENQESFAVSDVDKPTGKVSAVAEQYLLIKDIYTNVDETLIKAARLANYYNKSKDDVILKKLKETNILDYINEIIKNENKHIITSDQKITIENCIKALHEHPMINKYLFEKWEGYEAHNELEIYYTYKDLDLKSRLDRLLVNHEEKKLIYVDLKTTGKPAYQFAEDSFKFWNYKRQFSFYRLACSYKFPEYSYEAYIPVVDTKFYSTRLYKTSYVTLEEGRDDYEKCLDLILWHMKNDEWNYTKEEIENNLILNI